MRKAKNISLLEEECIMSLPLLARVSAGIGPEPTQVALNIALITNILLLGVPLMIKGIADILEKEVVPNSYPPTFIVCTVIYIVLNSSSALIGMVPGVILALFKLFSNHASESAKDGPANNEHLDPTFLEPQSHSFELKI